MVKTNMKFPGWSDSGVLPPIWPGAKGNSANRAPYRVQLSSVCEHLSTSPERIRILQGFLRYRADLHGIGLTSGFQWLNGSFVENIEFLEDRPPKDLDVVTFTSLSRNDDQASLLQSYPHLFDPAKSKAKYQVDGYFMFLGQPLSGLTVKSIAYWYSMWSRRRDDLWKGFVQVDLDPAGDRDAAAALKAAGGNKHE